MLATAAARPCESPRRRDFLFWLTGGAGALALPGMLSGCGGGNGSPTESDGNPDDGSLDGARRHAAIAAVEARCAALDAQALTPSAWLQALAAFMQSEPVYAEVGVEEEALTVWGVFTDGRVHLIDRSRRPTPAEPLAAAPEPIAQAARVELPKGRPARLLHSFGANFVGQDVVTRMSGWLSGKGYAVRGGQEGDARLTALRAVRGDGFFYINTHGGVKRIRRGDPTSPLFYSIQSSTLVDPALENTPEMRDDFANQRLTYFTAYNGITPTSRDTRYGITVHFVERYWSFETDSVVIINACNSANPNVASSFLNACLNKGAGVCLGWTEVVGDPVVYDAPAYLVDRMLGVNEEAPESPEQRPFPWDLVLAEMRAEGRDVFPHPDSGLVARFVAHSRAGRAHLLAPSLRHVEVDEYQRALRLVGAFGSVQGKVYIDGTERTVRSWAHDLVVCDLPDSGPGSCGPVHVEVGPHRSNVRRITEWRATFQYRYRESYHVGLRGDGQFTMRWRADIGATRDAPGQEPQWPVREAVATRESAAQITASGVYAPPPPGCAISWSGTARFPAQVAVVDGGGSTVMFSYLRINTADRTGAIGLALGAQAGSLFTETDCHGSHPVATPAAVGLLHGTQEFKVPGTTHAIELPALQVSFTEDFTLRGDRYVDEDGEVHLDWGYVTPGEPPRDDDGV